MTENKNLPPDGLPIGTCRIDLLGDTFTVLAAPEWGEDSEGKGMWTQDVQGPCGIVRMSVQALGYWN